LARYMRSVSNRRMKASVTAADCICMNLSWINVVCLRLYIMIINFITYTILQYILFIFNAFPYDVLVWPMSICYRWKEKILR
jgi:hypothetical protein